METSIFNELASAFALQTNQSLFLTGKAGTGKTTFLHRLKDISNKQMAVVAPTGVAAINAGGTTIHSMFQLPFTPFFPTPEGRKDLIGKMKMNGNRRQTIRELELLVIDEISMVRADLLDAVDCVLRHVRYRNEPFGGVQLIYIGDMFQLSPVASDNEWRYLSQYYKSPYFFHSQVVLEQPPVYIEFDKIYRQTNQNFISVLNEIRNDNLSSISRKLLLERFNPTFVPPVNDTYITLTTHNYKADKINAEELLKIKGNSFSFEADLKGEYPEKSYPTEKTLILKIGAKVMFLKNDTETPRRFFNGKIGVVQSIGDDTILIKCVGEDDVIELQRTEWENVRYNANMVTKQIEEEKLGSFIQFPLRLAWAITIHKSQGLTFDKIVIDAGDAFAPGQVYVALSRCRSLEGIVLLSKINDDSIYNDRTIVDYEQNKQSVEMLESQLDTSKAAYRKQLLQQLFDFRTVIALVNQLMKGVEKNKSSFNEETLPYLRDVQSQLLVVYDVGQKFQKQLEDILNSHPQNEDFLQNRLVAANTFFGEKIQQLCDTLAQSPAATDSRSYAADYDESILTIFSNICLTKHILKGISTDLTIEHYYVLKNSFIQPPFKINTYARSTMSLFTQLKYPDLYNLLAVERNSICEPLNLPVYIVAGTKTLFEMAQFLPQNKKELLQITGFGEAKVEKYGDIFLKVIADFTRKHNLSSKMNEKVSKNSKKNATQKKAKGETRQITLQMYLSGKSIEEIAEERSLAISTIGTHIAGFVESGKVNINDFLSFQQCEEAETMLNNSGELGSVYQLLSEKYTNIEITMLLAWIRNKKANK